ncbi:hypothetical protein Btru_063516 [Bulinus truncatus]|nr:hypothetical protein Btru_063516 [Bulinus truncatus]
MDKLKQAIFMDKLKQAIFMDKLKQAIFMDKLKQAIFMDKLKQAIFMDKLKQAIFMDKLKQAIFMDKLKQAIFMDKLKQAIFMGFDSQGRPWHDRHPPLTMGRGGPQPHYVIRPGDLQVEAAVVVDIEDPEALPFGGNAGNMGVYLVNHEMALGGDSDDGDDDDHIAEEYVEVDEQDTREDVEEEGCAAGQVCCHGDCNNNAVVPTNKIDRFWYLNTPGGTGELHGDSQHTRLITSSGCQTREWVTAPCDSCYNNNSNNDCDSGCGDPIPGHDCGSDLDQKPVQDVKRSGARNESGGRDTNQSMGGVIGTHSEGSSPFNIKGGDSGEGRRPDSSEGEMKGNSQAKASLGEDDDEETGITARDGETSARSQQCGDSQSGDYVLKRSELPPRVRRDAGQQVDLGVVCEADRGFKSRCNKCELLKILTTKAHDSQTNAENWTESEDVTLSDDPERTTISGFSSTLWHSDRMSLSGRPTTVHFSDSKETLHSELYQIEGSCLLTEDCQINVEFHKLMDLMDNLKNSAVVAEDDDDSISSDDGATLVDTPTASSTYNVGRKFVKSVTFPEPVACTASSEFDLGTFFLKRNSVGDYGLPLYNPIKPSCLQAGAVVSKSDCVLKASSEIPRLVENFPKEVEPKSPKVASLLASHSYCNTPDSKDCMEMVSKSVNVNMFTETSALLKCAQTNESVIARDVNSPNQKAASRKSLLSNRRRSNMSRSHVCESGENTSRLSALRSLSPILSGCESSDVVSSSTSVDAADQIIEPYDESGDFHSSARKTMSGGNRTVRSELNHCETISEEKDSVSIESDREKPCLDDESQLHFVELQPSRMQLFSLSECQDSGNSSMVKTLPLTDPTYVSGLKPGLLRPHTESDVTPPLEELHVTHVHREEEVFCKSVFSVERLQKDCEHIVVDAISDFSSKSTNRLCCDARVHNISQYNEYINNSLPQSEDLDRSKCCKQTLQQESNTLAKATTSNASELSEDTKMLTCANLLLLSCDKNEIGGSLKAEEEKSQSCAISELEESLLYPREITAENMPCFIQDVHWKTELGKVTSHSLESLAKKPEKVLGLESAESESMNELENRLIYLDTNTSQPHLKSKEVVNAFSSAEKFESSSIAASEIFSMSLPSPRDVASNAQCCSQDVAPVPVAEWVAAVKETVSVSNQCETMYQQSPSSRLSTYYARPSPAGCREGAIASFSFGVERRSPEFRPAQGARSSTDVSRTLQDTCCGSGTCRAGATTSVDLYCGQSAGSRSAAGHSGVAGGQLDGSQKSARFQPAVKCNSRATPGMTPVFSHCAMCHSIAAYSSLRQPLVSFGDASQPVPTPSDTYQPIPSPSVVCHPIPFPGATGQLIAAPRATCQPRVSPSATCQLVVSPGATCQPRVSPSATCQLVVSPGATCQPRVSPSATCQLAPHVSPEFHPAPHANWSVVGQYSAPLSTICEVSSSSVAASPSDVTLNADGYALSIYPSATLVFDDCISAVSQQCVSTDPVSQQCVSTDALSQQRASTDPVSQQCVSTDPVSQQCVSTGAVSQQCVSTDPVSQQCVSTDPVSQQCVSTGAVSQQRASTGAVYQQCESTGAVSQQRHSTGTVSQQCVSTDALSQQCVSTGAVSQQCVSTGAVSQQCVSTDPVSQQCVSTGAVSQQRASTGAVYQQCVSTGAVSQQRHSTGTVSQQCVSTDPVSQQCVSTGAVSQQCVSTDALSQQCVSTGPVSQQCVSTDAVSQSLVSTGVGSQPRISSAILPDVDTYAEAISGDGSHSAVSAGITSDANTPAGMASRTGVSVTGQPKRSPKQGNDATVCPSVISRLTAFGSITRLPNDHSDAIGHLDATCHGGSFHSGLLQVGIADEFAYQRDITLSDQSYKGKSLTGSVSSAKPPLNSNNEDGENKIRSETPAGAISKLYIAQEYDGDESYLDLSSFAIEATQVLECVTADRCVDSVVNAEVAHKFLEPKHSYLANQKDLVLPYICEKPRQRTPVTSRPTSLPEIEPRGQPDTETRPTDVPAPLPRINEQAKDKKHGLGYGNEKIIADQLWQKYVESQREKIRKKRTEFFANHLGEVTLYNEGLTRLGDGSNRLSSPDAKSTAQSPKHDIFTRSKSILKSNLTKVPEVNDAAADGKSVGLSKSKHNQKVSFFKQCKSPKRRMVTFDTPHSSPTCDTWAVQEDFANGNCRECMTMSPKTCDIPPRKRKFRGSDAPCSQFSSARGVTSESSLQQCNTLEEVEALTMDEDTSINSDLVSLRADSSCGCGKEETLSVGMTCHGDCGGIKEGGDENLPPKQRTSMTEVQWDAIVCNKLPVLETDILVYNVADVRGKTLMDVKAEHADDAAIEKNDGELLNLQRSEIKNDVEMDENNDDINKAANIVTDDNDAINQNANDTANVIEAEGALQGSARELTHSREDSKTGHQKIERGIIVEVREKGDNRPTTIIDTKAVRDKQAKLMSRQKSSCVGDVRQQDVCDSGGRSATIRAPGVLKGRLPKLKNYPRVIAESHYYHQSNTVNIIVKPINVSLDKVNVKVDIKTKMVRDPTKDTSDNHKLLLISFDGFRWDYILSNRARTPNFDRIISEGVTVQHGLKNAFVTKTFPNHFTLATGLWEESHGIVGNEMYDPHLNQTFTPQNDSANNDPAWFDVGARSQYGS